MKNSFMKLNHVSTFSGKGQGKTYTFFYKLSILEFSNYSSETKKAELNWPRPLFDN
jgi:hypothetical protein